MASTQQHLPIEDIQHDLIFLKDGGVSLVLETSAVNFGLLFETEQLSIIRSFAGMLNSLSFPIQIAIHSKRLDVSSYLSTIDQALAKQTNPKLQKLTSHYRRFVENIIREKDVLDKHFYVIIKASYLEMSLLHQSVEQRQKKATTILSPRKDHVAKQLGRIGIKTKQLNTIDLVKLFYISYNSNPDQPEPALQPNGMPEILTPEIDVSLPNPSAIPTPQPKPKVVIAVPNINPIPHTQSEAPPIRKEAPLTPPNPLPPTSYAPLSPPFVVEELPDDAGS